MNITDPLTSQIHINLEVCVANQGTVDSGPFNIEVLGEPFGRVTGLAAGAQTCVQGSFVPFEIDVRVDADGEVAETDEVDNFDTYFVPQPTPPPFCLQTSTPTETGTVSETPTYNDTETPTPGATSTATTVDTETGTPEPSPTPTETPTVTETPLP